jgi:hypothetical protein
VELGWQAARATRISVDSDVRIRGFEQAGSDVLHQHSELLVGQVPQRFEVAASHAFDEGRLSVGASALYQPWSWLRTGHDEADASFMGDAWGVRVGIVDRLSAAFSLRAGVGYAKSPVPEQTGRTNLVDNDRLTGSVGLGYETATEIGAICIDLASRLTRLLPRTHLKRSDAVDPVYDEYPDTVDPKTGALVGESLGFQTNNPGFPGYSSGGWVGATSVTLALVR